MDETQAREAVHNAAWEIALLPDLEEMDWGPHDAALDTYKQAVIAALPCYRIPRNNAPNVIFAICDQPGAVGYYGDGWQCPTCTVRKEQGDG